jgi:hypothetical protein
VVPIGYETDVYTLAPANAALTAGTWYFPATAPYYFAGTDFDKGVIRLTISSATAGTACAIAIQSSPDGGTTWFPDAASIASADTPGYETVTTAVGTAATHLEFMLSSFPGNLFRLGVLVTGGTTIVLASATGDFLKRVADQS